MSKLHERRAAVAFSRRVGLGAYHGGAYAALEPVAGSRLDCIEACRLAQ
jgi:hypothetical protein